MRILVTGGAGFIGSHIVRELLVRGHKVRVLDDFSTGSPTNVAEVLADIELVKGDIRNYELTRNAMQGVECVFHEAALSSVPRSIADPMTSASVNLVGTTAILKAAVDAGVRRVVYAASSSAYGESTESVKTETLPSSPLSPYAVAKLAGEYMLHAFTHCYGIETIGLRYFNVFGERQDPHSQYAGVIAKFCKIMLAGQRPTIFGDGDATRDFTYVQNVVEANLLAMTAPVKPQGVILNIACGTSTSLNQLVMHLNAILGTDLAPVYADSRPGDIKHSCADITRAASVLGYRPGVDFAVGLRRTVDWYTSALWEWEQGGR